MADTDNTQDKDDGSVYMTLGEALHWIAFRKEIPTDDDRSVAAFDQAEPKLATAYKAGRVRLLGRDGEFSRRNEIPVLQLDDPHFEAAGNAVYEKPEPWDGRRWIDVCLDRQEVLAEWPDPNPSRAEPTKPPKPGQTEHGPSAVRPNRRGRRKGTVGYDSTDMPLIEEMNRLIKSGKATGPWGAALLVVDDAKGTGSAVNKTKRLTGKYAEKYGPGEGHSV